MNHGQIEISNNFLARQTFARKYLFKSSVYKKKERKKHKTLWYESIRVNAKNSIAICTILFKISARFARFHRAPQNSFLFYETFIESYILNERGKRRIQETMRTLLSIVISDFTNFYTITSLYLSRTHSLSSYT